MAGWRVVVDQVESVLVDKGEAPRLPAVHDEALALVESMGVVAAVRPSRPPPVASGLVEVESAANGEASALVLALHEGRPQVLRRQQQETQAEVGKGILTSPWAHVLAASERGRHRPVRRLPKWRAMR